MSAYIPVNLQQKIRTHFANCCAYCRTNEVLTATTFEFDHIQPRSTGGQTAWENICLTCPSCNRYKSDRQIIADVITKSSIPLFNPQTQIWNQHFSWNEDASEIIALTDIGRVTIEALRINRPPLVRVRKMWVKLGEHPPKLD